MGYFHARKSRIRSGAKIACLICSAIQACQTSGKNLADCRLYYSPFSHTAPSPCPLSCSSARVRSIISKMSSTVTRPSGGLNGRIVESSAILCHDQAQGVVGLSGPTKAAPVPMVWHGSASLTCTKLCNSERTLSLAKGSMVVIHGSWGFYQRTEPRGLACKERYSNEE